MRSLAGFRMWLVLVGCADTFVEAPLSDARLAGRALEEGTPDALGVVAMLNDPGTTVTVLDVDAGLDVRAARNLIAHRDGGDPFDSVAEIDAVPRVGEATLALLVDFARAGGWVTDDTLYGVVEGVTLSRDEAAAALRIANTAGLEVLDIDVALDARAAQGLVAQRPFATVEEVALVPYVGATALGRLVDWGLAHPAAILDEDTALATLDGAVDGLWFMSESDYPLVPWSVVGTGPLAADEVKTALASVYVPEPGRPGLDALTVEESTLGWVFDRTTVVQEGWDPSQLEALPQWQAVRDVFEIGLRDPQVFRLGVPNSFGDLTGAIDVFVLGTTSDGVLVGIRTVSVET